MPRLTTLAVGAVAAVMALGGCSQANVGISDAYKVGCPAIDAVAASGSVAGQLAVTGLEQLRDSGNVSGDAKQWLETVIAFLKDPNQVSAESKKMLKDGCKANGYTLQNVG